MNEQISILLNGIKQDTAVFKDILAFIDARYQHQPTAFKNGEAYNEATQNQGSARVFAFAQLNGLSKEDTLQLFAEHYNSVLDTPNGSDHQNIRQFMQYGWDGLVFEGVALADR